MSRVLELVSTAWRRWAWVRFGLLAWMSGVWTTAWRVTGRDEAAWLAMGFLVLAALTREAKQ